MTGADPQAPATRRLLIYAHFDPEDVVRDYVLHALRAMGGTCSAIRFVTTSRLPERELSKLAPYAPAPLQVENAGFDFAMWKRALRPSDADDFDEVVLMNSSVYGPLWDPATLFDAMRADPCDAWGITESLEHDRHLQSYFLVFRRAVLTSDAFRAFWGSVLPYRNKRQVIRSYEIGLTQWLEDAGFTVGAYCPWRQVVRYVAARPRHAMPIGSDVTGLLRLAFRGAAAARRALHRVLVGPVNPTVAFPQELIELGVPFLKLEVMRDNPLRRDLAPIERQLTALGYPTEHLVRSRPSSVRGGMHTTPAPRCPVCGGEGGVLYEARADAFRAAASGTWRIRRCGAPACGCAWLDPVPLESELHRAYAGYYTHAEGAREIRYVEPAYGPVDRLLLRALRASLVLLRTHPRRGEYWLHGLGAGGGRLLEVGCGDGSRLLDLERRGWNAEGQDVDGSAVSHARAKGLRVHAGALEEAGLPEESYDVVLMSHVIEHVHRPVELLRRCARLLKPGGRLVLSTPNVEGLGHRLYRRDWLSLDSPRHLVVHSRRSLALLLQRAGFGEISIRTIPLNAEVTSMHSRDIKYLGWTDMNTVPRLGRELVPVAVQVVAELLHSMAPSTGEECFAEARRPAATTREAER